MEISAVINAINIYLSHVSSDLSPQLPECSVLMNEISDYPIFELSYAFT
jgi:hypothetical protein